MGEALHLRVLFLALVVLGASMLAGSGPVFAKECQADCAAKYQRLAKVRRTQVPVDYADPGDPISYEKIAPIEGQEEREHSEGNGRFLTYALLALLIGGLIWILAKFGGSSAQIVGKQPDEGEYIPGQPVVPDVLRDAGRIDQPDREFLLSLAAMEDRRRAMHLLLNRVLLRQSLDHKLRLRRSMTVREVVALFPQDKGILPRLKNLARETELVWFGGRAVSDSAFQKSLEIGRELLLGRVRT